MRTHEDYRQALALHALRSLDEAEQSDVQAHLDACPSCLVELAALREAAASLVLLARPIEPPAHHWRRLIDALPAETSEANAGAANVGGGIAAAFHRMRGLLRSRRVVWTVRFACAALIVLLVASEVDLLRDLDRAAAEIARMREIGEFVTSPGVTMVPLWGTEVAPGAHAKLAYEHATGRFMLFSSRMPAPPPGRRYQLWVIADRVRPAGAFSPGSPDGTLRTLPREDAPFLFGMSLEPDGAGEADEPTGGMVLMSAPVRHPR
jgi:hypothetical protein